MATIIETRSIDGEQVAVSTLDDPAETAQGTGAPLARLAIVRSEYRLNEALTAEPSPPARAETNGAPEVGGDGLKTDTVQRPLPTPATTTDSVRFQESAASRAGVAPRVPIPGAARSNADAAPIGGDVLGSAVVPTFTESPQPTAAPRPTTSPTSVSPTPTPIPIPLPTLAPTPTPEPTQAPTQPPAPPAPATGPVLVAKAKPTTAIVETFDAAGNPAPVRYRYLNGSEIDYGLRNPTFFGGTLYLQVVSGTPQDEFVEVLMPVRPAGTTGWVRSDAFEFFSSSYSIEVNITTNTVRVWDGQGLVVETSAVTGRSDRPTPVARTYVDEIIPGPNAAYGPKMLTLALFSESLNTFSDALPKIAIHGTNQPELMGSYASSGCIRIPNNVIERLATLVPPGTPVSIVR